MAMTGMPLANQSGPTRDLVFISYSHRDKVWLERLLIFLKPYTRQNLKIWADPYIKVGDKWRREISAALSRSCVGVLLLSAESIASDFIYEKEIPSLIADAEAGSLILIVVPISTCKYDTTGLSDYHFAHSPNHPLDVLPRPRRNAALVQIVDKIAEAALAAAVAAPAVSVPESAPTVALEAVALTDRIAALHGVPSQRPNYLRRREYFDRVKRAVLDSTRPAVGIAGATQGGRIGLHGMGGIGKTVLAIDLVNDEEVRRAFPDGIFWLTLGQTIEPLQLQGKLTEYMTGEAKVYASVNQTRNQLRQVFDDKACLLVLDDLWHGEDAKPFDVLGPRSRLLVTTRDADLLGDLRAQEMSLDVLGEEQALELLAAWAGQDSAALPGAAAKVAASCGYVPLALAAVGARVRVEVQG
jgi:hypothetical protein